MTIGLKKLILLCFRYNFMYYCTSKRSRSKIIFENAILLQLPLEYLLLHKNDPDINSDIVQQTKMQISWTRWQFSFPV